MKALRFLVLALVAGLVVGRISAADLKSGPQVDEKVGAYEVVKCAGNTEDGVKVGEQLCYRCKMGERPVVMIFARKADDKLAKLTQELDKISEKNKDKKFTAFVNLLGTDADKGKATAEKFVKDSKLENIAVVVPDDQPNGPKGYKIAKDAEVTVVLYEKGVVKANYAVTAGGLDDEMVKKIVSDTSLILN